MCAGGIYRTYVEISEYVAVIGSTRHAIEAGPWQGGNKLYKLNWSTNTTDMDRSTVCINECGFVTIMCQVSRTNSCGTSYMGHYKLGR